MFLFPFAGKRDFMYGFLVISIIQILIVITTFFWHFTLKPLTTFFSSINVLLNFFSSFLSMIIQHS